MRAITILCVDGACAALVWHAALVQGADPRIVWAGAVIGVVLGWALVTGRASLRFVAFALGAFGGLQFFQCLPCDGSPFAMPLFGAIVGGLAGRLVQIAFGIGARPLPAPPWYDRTVSDPFNSPSPPPARPAGSSR